MNRRRFLLSALATPAIVRTSSLMAIMPAPTAGVPLTLSPGEWFATDEIIAAAERRFAASWTEALIWGRSKDGLITMPPVPYCGNPLIAALRPLPDAT